MLFCRYCGNKAPDDAMFCGNCGKRFTLPSFEPTSINNISQSVPSNSQKAEEERSRRGQTPFVPLPEQSSGSAVPHIEGTPQVGSVPSASAPMTGFTTKAGTSALVKIVIVAASCAVVITGSVKAVPILLQRGNNTQSNTSHKTMHPLPTHSPTPSLSQLNVYVSSQDGNVYALNASNGKIRWKFVTGSQYISPVQVVNGVAYFIVDENINTNPNATSTMYVLNEKDGTVIHRYNLPYFTLETGAYIPSFKVVNGNIYFSSPQMAFAINGNDGTLLWKYSWFGRGVSDPVVVNNVIYYVTGVGVIYAFKNTDGTLLWRYDLGPDAIVHAGIIGNYPAPVVINNTLYVVGWRTDNLYSINLNTHALRWHIHLNNAQTNTLRASNNILYVGTFISPNPSIIFAVRADTGMLLWSKQNIKFQLVNTDALYCTGVDANGGSIGDIYALRSSTGTTIWHIQMSNVHIFYMTSIQKTVYMSSDTTLYALSSTNGSMLWQVPISGSLTGE